MVDYTIQHNKALEFLNSFKADELIKDKRVLDMGCGDGFASVEFIKRGAKRVDAVDIASEPTLISDDIIFHRSIPGNTFDIIWHHHMLEHVEDCIGMLKILRQHLHIDGWMWMTVPNMARCDVYSPGHIHNFQAPQLVEILRICGFGTSHIKIWVKGGQLRVRVPCNGEQGYPYMMKALLLRDGRCPAGALEWHDWN